MEKEPFAVSLARAEDARNLEEAREAARTRKDRKVKYPAWWTAITPYSGGKQRAHLRKFVTDHLPTEDIDIYVEPFAGAASIFLARPRVEQEVLIERCRHQWALLTTLRDQPERLVTALANYPVKAEPHLFQIAKESLLEGRCVDELDLAKCQLIRNALSVNAKGESYRPSSVMTASGEVRTRPSLKKIVTTAAKSSPRLKGVEILNADCVPLLTDYDSPKTMFYVDPPYLHSTRSTKKLYNHEMSDDDHERLLKAIVKLEGKVAISGFDNDLYNDYLPLGRWRKAYHVCTPVNKEKVEVLWMNYR